MSTIIEINCDTVSKFENTLKQYNLAADINRCLYQHGVYVGYENCFGVVYLNREKLITFADRG